MCLVSVVAALVYAVVFVSVGAAVVVIVARSAVAFEYVAFGIAYDVAAVVMSVVVYE